MNGQDGISKLEKTEKVQSRYIEREGGNTARERIVEKRERERERQERKIKYDRKRSEKRKMEKSRRK